MLRKSMIVAITAVLLLTSCGQPDRKPISAQERARLSAQTDSRVAQSSNTFGLELIGKLKQEKPGENIVVSPISIVQALSMTMNGAAGPTLDQMAKTLHLEGLPAKVLNDEQRKLRELLLQPGPGVKLSMANSLWLQQGWPFKKPYLDSVKSAYGAELNERKLSDPAVLKEINNWVDKETQGLIPTILDEPVSEMTKLMLLNALYFNGTWKRPFEPEDTKDGDFTKSDGKVQHIPFMHQEGKFEYDETDEYQAVRLPYGDGQMGMLVVLPRKNADRMTTAKLLADPGLWTKPFTRFNGQLALPKFRVEGMLDLIDTLKAMGMSLPFDPGKADFNEMADTSGDRRLFISKVVHKTLVDVSEQGTEAAAVTMVGVETTSAPPEGNFQMTVNRPFLFAIQDLQSGVILFVGSVETL
ncbi:serpin family protein [Paenibacillus sp. sptzw28]|uniref:serpin family protein n=1 Tax=Paenibacillus sp. sptzw28 TaxID=715179 RepID=UPI001C6EDB30|nr:serpin family protein [Paenibacillus sp. sptzw28]QYR23580.1 serpin family protein [Paenibacillus sp. sptzw28]